MAKAPKREVGTLRGKNRSCANYEAIKQRNSGTEVGENLMVTPRNVEDYRGCSLRKRLPRMVFDYLDGGAEGETRPAAESHSLQRSVF